MQSLSGIHHTQKTFQIFEYPNDLQPYITLNRVFKTGSVDVIEFDDEYVLNALHNSQIYNYLFEIGIDHAFKTEFASALENIRQLIGCSFKITFLNNGYIVHYINNGFVIKREIFSNSHIACNYANRYLYKHITEYFNSSVFQSSELS